MNITTNLVDWSDYPASVWVTDQNITKILSFNFHNFFDTNIYFPHKYTLLFADITLPQSILGLLPFLLTKNLILSFNIMFLLNFILNFTFVYLFWKQIFKKSLVAFFGSLFFIFSPFFFLELGHLPDLTYWPFFLTLYLIFKHEETRERARIWTLIPIGLGITIQFLSNVYLTVFLLFSILIFYLLKLTSLKSIRLIAFKVFFIFFIFFLTSGVFIKGYIDMRNTYHAKRTIQEYIMYSAGLSDYLFSASISSIVHRSPVMNSWNRYNAGNNLFPGFLISILAIFALFKIQKIKQSVFLSLKLNRRDAYFFILIAAGLIFSLGPRLNFNGSYVNIPLPYNLLLKYVPMLEAIRVIIRWSFLFYLGLTYFSLISLSSLFNKSYYKTASLLVLIIFVLEYIPFGLQSVKNTYITSDYQLLRNMCSNDKKVLIELPLTHLDAAPNIREGLKYITTVVLASAYHRCLLVNGYSGFDLPENFTLSAILSEYIAEGNTKAFIAEMKKRKINIVKFNQKYFIKELKESGFIFIQKLEKETAVRKASDDVFLFVKSI